MAEGEKSFSEQKLTTWSEQIKENITRIVGEEQSNQQGSRYPG
jgi:hypothetical protein